MSNIKKTEDIVSSDSNNVYYSVEELCEKFKTPAAVLSGIKTMNGWKPGKQLKEAEYKKAVEQFNGLPAGRR